MKNTILTFSALAAVAALTLTSCAYADSEPTQSQGPQAQTTPVETEDNVRIQSSKENVWARATDSEMTSAFGTIENLTDEDLTITAASSEVAGMVELHEIIEEDGEQIMQQIEGGFTIPASGSLELETGGNHLMLMGLQQELLPGEVLEISLEFDDGTQESIEAMVRNDGGQDEPYDHGDTNEGHEDDHASQDSDDHEH